MKTQVGKKEEVTREWYLVDAENLVLGRIATRIADVLRSRIVAMTFCEPRSWTRVLSS